LLPWKPTVSFIGQQKRRKQPERYATFGEAQIYKKSLKALDFLFAVLYSNE
jgi:hypothetical protein